MKKKIVYRNAPKDIADALMVAEPVPDFLPSPEQLVFKEDTVKITLSLSKGSVAFFKRKARACGVPYQRMIKTVVDKYAHRFQ
jgi:hypothetical protein